MAIAANRFSRAALAEEIPGDQDEREPRGGSDRRRVPAGNQCIEPGGAGGDEHDGLAHADAHGALGLTGELARLDGDLVRSVRKRLADDAQSSILRVNAEGK